MLTVSPIKINYSGNPKSFINRLKFFFQNIIINIVSFLPRLKWHVVTVYFAAIDIAIVFAWFL